MFHYSLHCTTTQIILAAQRKEETHERWNKPLSEQYWHMLIQINRETTSSDLDAEFHIISSILITSFQRSLAIHPLLLL